MQLTLLTLGVSGSVLMLLAFLYRIEESRGRRFFPRMRSGFDQFVVWLYTGLSHVSKMLGRDTIRHTIHFVFHQGLKMLRNIFRLLERKTDQLLRANKELAKRTLTQEGGVRTKLEEMGHHKLDTALTQRERRVRKEKSIGTKL